MRFTALLAALGAAFALGHAQAAPVVIDNFNSPFNSTFSMGTDLWSSSGTLATGDSSILATSRILTNRIVTSSVTNPFGTLSSISVGPAPNFFANALNVANANGIQSVSTVTWVLNTPAISTLLAPSSSVASLVLDVILSDTGLPSADTQLLFELIGPAPDSVATTLTNIFMPSSGNASYSFPLNSVARSSLSTGSRLRMTVSGAPGLDFSLDTLSLNVSEPQSVPEPTSLALVSLALLGIGVLTRRRQAA